MGYRRLPQSVITSLEIPSDEDFIVGASRDLSGWEALGALPLAREADPEHLRQGRTVVYTPSGTRFARMNTDGYVVRRTDLPKVERSFAWEAPNFGRSDTSTRFQSRLVYQREVIHGRGMELTVDCVEKDNGHVVVMVRAQFLFSRTTGYDARDLLMASALVNEATHGSPTVMSPRLTRQEWEDSILVVWGEFLPAGTYTPEQLYQRAAVDLSTTPRVERSVMVERLEMIQSTYPGQVVIGRSGAERYVAFKYREDLVALENFNYGNALYVMYEDWDQLSRRTRIELLTGSMQGFDRVVHTGRWRDKFRNILTTRGHDSVTPPE